MIFEITTGNLINIVMIAMGIGVSALSIIQISKAPIPKQFRRFFIVFLSLVIGYITMHLARQLLEGHPGAAVHSAIRTVTCIEFLISGFMTFLLVIMILYSAKPDQKNGSELFILMIITSVHIIMLIVSQFTDLYYYFDGNNVYHRSERYLLSNAAPLVMMIQGMYLLIRFRDRFSRRIARAYLIYLLAPLAAMLLQAVYSEVQFVIFATVGAAVNMFAVITDDLTEKYEKQQAEASRIETELSMATRIQADMLPNIFPAFPERKEFEIFASMTPAKEVGGDFYDFFLIDHDHLGIVMADVSGKGVPAALFMMASKILVQNYATMHMDPKAALEAANNQICQSNREEMFVTVWLGILDLRTGVLRASNAGHEYPAIKQPGRMFELYKDKHGFVLGGMAGIKYQEYEIRLEKGSVIFLYTDGVAEATNGKKELFGTDRMLTALNQDPEADPQIILKNTMGRINDFVAGEEQFDDLTMLCLRYNGYPE